MIYSKSSQYAIRSLVHLAAQPEGKFKRIEEIATEEGIPFYFLAKILQRLSRKRFVRSVKGVKGGFALNHTSKKLTLFEIVDSIDDLSVSLADCIMGGQPCSDTKNCLLHDEWAKLRNHQIDFLKRITIEDLAATQSRRGKGQHDKRKI